jgi:hypothetical protein
MSFPFDGSLAQSIWAIYNETVVRQPRRFSHFGKDFETLRSEGGTFPDNGIFIGAFFVGELIACTEPEWP